MNKKPWLVKPEADDLDTLIQIILRNRKQIPENKAVKFLYMYRTEDYKQIISRLDYIRAIPEDQIPTNPEEYKEYKEWYLYLTKMIVEAANIQYRRLKMKEFKEIYEYELDKLLEERI